MEHCPECNGKISCKRIGENKRCECIIVTCADEFRCPILANKDCLDCGYNWNGICDRAKYNDKIPNEYFVNGGHPSWCPLDKLNVR
jgi:hypothetical protein